MPVRNLKSFNAKLKKSTINLVDKDLVTFQRRLALEVLRRVVLKTPVKTGRARGNWQTTVGKPAEDIVAGTTSGPPKERKWTASSSLAGLSKVGRFQTIFISNNLPYILRLENGWSEQAPQGMVALTLQELSGGL